VLSCCASWSAPTCMRPWLNPSVAPPGLARVVCSGASNLFGWDKASAKLVRCAGRGGPSDGLSDGLSGVTDSSLLGCHSDTGQPALQLFFWRVWGAHGEAVAILATSCHPNHARDLVSWEQQHNVLLKNADCVKGIVVALNVLLRMVCCNCFIAVSAAGLLGCVLAAMNGFWRRSEVLHLDMCG
jgi:hypothetical protein